MDQFPSASSISFPNTSSGELCPPSTVATNPLLNPMDFTMTSPLHPSWLSHIPSEFNPTPMVPQYYPPAQQQFLPLGLNAASGYALAPPAFPDPYPGIHQLRTGNLRVPCPPISPSPELRKVESKLQKQHRTMESPETGLELKAKYPFSTEQKSLLMARFRQGGKVGMKEVAALADKTGLSPKQVKTWFANRKAKEKLLEKAQLNKMNAYLVQSGVPMEYNQMTYHGYPVDRQF